MASQWKTRCYTSRIVREMQIPMNYPSPPYRKEEEALPKGTWNFGV